MRIVCLQYKNGLPRHPDKIIRIPRNDMHTSANHNRFTLKRKAIKIPKEGLPAGSPYCAYQMFAIQIFRFTNHGLRITIIVGCSPVQFIGLEIMLLLSTVDVLSKYDTGERRSPLQCVLNDYNTNIIVDRSLLIVLILDIIFF